MYNFEESACRHYEDGKYLYDDKRVAAADHLIGISAECFLKDIMLKTDSSISKNGDIDRRYKKHINNLWNEFQIFFQGRSMAKYILMLPQGNPFSSWEASQRYFANAFFDRKAVDIHYDVLKKVRIMAAHMKIDGRI